MQMQLTEEEFEKVRKDIDPDIFSIVGRAFSLMPNHPYHNVPQPEKYKFLNDVTDNIIYAIINLKTPDNMKLKL